MGRSLPRRARPRGPRARRPLAGDEAAGSVAWRPGGSLHGRTRRRPWSRRRSSVPGRRIVTVAPRPRPRSRAGSACPREHPADRALEAPRPRVPVHAARRAPRPRGAAPVPADVRPVGRSTTTARAPPLTDDGALAHALTDPRFRHPRTYWAQVERVPDEAALEQLRRGVVLGAGDPQPTRPARVRRLEADPPLPRGPVPIRFEERADRVARARAHEGRNARCADDRAVGHPTLRLVRVALGPLRLLELGLAPGGSRALEPDEERALRASLAPQRGRRRR